MPPQVNAELTKVGSAGTPDDWDTPAGASDDDSKFAGAIPAYYLEKTRRVGGAEAGRTAGATSVLDVLTTRTLIVDTADLDPIGLDSDDVITFTVDGGPAQTGTAKAITRSALAGMPSSVQTTRIELENA